MSCIKAFEYPLFTLQPEAVPLPRPTLAWRCFLGGDDCAVKPAVLLFLPILPEI